VGGASASGITTGSGSSGVSYVGAGAFTYLSTGTGTVPLPAGIQAGDIVVLFGTNPDPTGGGFGSGPSGWTKKLTGVWDVPFWKRAVTSEVTPYVQCADDAGAVAFAGQVFAFRGCVASGDPFDVADANETENTTGTLVTGSALTTLAKSLLGMFVHGTVAVSAAGGAADTLVAGGPTGGNSIALAYKSTVTTAATQAAPTATMASSSDKVFWTFALKSA
jgi:hypothetical protein